HVEVPHKASNQGPSGGGEYRGYQKLVYSHEGPLDPNRCCLACMGIGALDARIGARKRQDRSHDLRCADDVAGILREIDVERGLHLLVRVIGRCVFDPRDLVAELSGKANGRFDTGMRYQSDDDELMNAMVL